MTMGDVKQFDKYGRYGGYHWHWYGRKPSYTDNADFLKQWVAEKNTLDIGAGDGVITYLLGIRGIDNDARAVSIAIGKGAMVDHGDAYALPYQDEEFDSALMSDVIEHFSDIVKPLAETRRVIKKYFYVNIPQREKFYEPDHYHSWTPEQFIADVEKSGFVLEEGPISQHTRHYFKFRKI